MKFYTVILNNEIYISKLRSDTLHELERHFRIVNIDDRLNEIIITQK